MVADAHIDVFAQDFRSRYPRKAVFATAYRYNTRVVCCPRHWSFRVGASKRQTKLCLL